MRLSKRILKSSFIQTIICRLAWAAIWFIYITSRWEVKGFDNTKKLLDSGKPLIFVFWHGRLLMISPFRPKNHKVNVVISTHNDGQLITRVMEIFGFSMIRGSSRKKDGMSAFKEVTRALENNELVAITPDGPRGPRMRIGGNVIKIAQMHNCPIIPVTYSISKCKILRSWDRFMLAKPFARGAFIYGEPLYVKGDDDAALKEAGFELENRLNNITRQADEMMGLVPVEPEEVPQK
jgi:lysophospholipid acyltransferase (LPLAT)-like uncharacterized protein